MGAEIIVPALMNSRNESSNNVSTSGYCCQTHHEDWAYDIHAIGMSIGFSFICTLICVLISKILSKFFD